MVLRNTICVPKKLFPFRYPIKPRRGPSCKPPKHRSRDPYACLPEPRYNKNDRTRYDF